MSFAKTYSAQIHSLLAHIIEIEVDISSKTLHAFSIVGLPDKAVEEARDRISAAIKNSNFKSPKSANQKVVISLAPANLKKVGSAYDVAMALAYLKANGDIAFNSEEKIFVGELALDGTLRPVQGVLALTEAAKKAGFKEIYVPKGNAEEAALIGGIKVYAPNTLLDIIDHLDTNKEDGTALFVQEKTVITPSKAKRKTSFDEIQGQAEAKRSLIIAAAGGHNVALYGPPGTGKTMLARAFRDILPPLTAKKVLESTSIHSIAGTLTENLVLMPPFRAPHHSASHTAVVGGGTIPKPGEVTLAHNGVLFLDEFPEFERRVIDGLRVPLEDKVVHITRMQGMATFPANFILIAALNPCPCGNFGSHKECVCLPYARERYRKKISGPIVDRIDMWVEVPHIDISLLAQKKITSHQTKEASEKVLTAREKQKGRFGTPNKTNGLLSVKELRKHVYLDKNSEQTLARAAKALDLSPRSYHRIIKLARTIADLDNRENVEEVHILEALQYRPKKLT